MNINIKKRLDTPKWLSSISPLIAIVLAFLFGGIFLLITGYNPIEVYLRMLYGSLGSKYNISETLVKTIPLLITGLGVTIAFKMKLLNIGAEGQFYMGAFLAGSFALYFTDLPVYIMLPVLFILGFIGGALWGVIAIIPRAFWGTNEVLTTLLLNYVAILWFQYLVHGPLRGKTTMGFPRSDEFVANARIPTIFGTRIHIGLIIGIIIALILLFVFKYTKFGFKIRILGDNDLSARYAGINVKRTILKVMFLSGGLAGLAGMMEVSGVIHRLQPVISPEYGYTAILIAFLARLNPVNVIIASIFISMVHVGGYSLQIIGIPDAIAQILEGLILFSVLIGDFFIRYRINFKSKKK